jgi:hypothetical protein
MNHLGFISFSLLIGFILQQNSLHYCPSKQNSTEWTVSNLITKNSKKVQILGHPQIIKCKYGKAVAFNGVSDGIFIEEMPLANFDQFTIEAVIRPDTGGNFEQRFFHCGTVTNNRILFELRATKTDWYFDAFIKSGEERKALIDSSLLHPLGQWYHLAFVIDRGKLSTYVNGKKELEGNITLTPQWEGITSIGVRQNKQSWFKGAIFKIKVTSKVLAPNSFMSY